MEPDKSSMNSQSASEKHTVSFFTRCSVIAFSVVWIFVSIPILAIVMAVVIIAWVIYRLNSCCSHILGSCPEFLTTTELYWLFTSKGSSSVIQCLIQLDRCATVSSIRNVISNRLSNSNTAGFVSFPRLQKRLVRTWISCAWYLDNDFSLENHVSEMEGKFKSEGDVESHIALMANKDLEYERPLWNIQVLQCGWENKTYLLIRVHPCFANGDALIELLCQPLEGARSHKQPEEENSSSPLLSIISGVLFGPLLLAYFKVSSRSNSPNVFPGLVPSGKHSIAWSRPINLQQVLESKAVANCQLTDFALCAASGTVRSILQHGTKDQSETFMTNLLYSFQRCSDTCIFSCAPEVPWDSQFATIPVQLPLRTEGIIPRLWDTLHTTRTLQQYCAQSISSGILQTLILLIPSKVSALWLSRTLASGQCLVSCFSASPTTLSVADVAVSNIVQWFPPGRNAFMSLTVQTYHNELRVGVVVDTCLYAKANKIAEQFATEIDTLVAFLAHRRVRRKHRHKKSDDFEDIDEFDDYLDQENDQDVTFNDEICRPCWSQRDADIIQDEQDQPQTSQQSSLEIIQLDEPSSPSTADGCRERSHQLSTKTKPTLEVENDTGHRLNAQDGVTIHVVSEDVQASVIDVEAVDGGGLSSGDRRPPNTPRRESHGMTVITSVAVNVFDTQQPFDFSPSVERRLSVPADV